VDERVIVQSILSTGLAPEFVHGLAEEIRTGQKDFPGSSLSEVFRKCLQWKLMDAVEVTGPAVEGTKIWVLVGPTGVGKTTTLAKLAAHFSLKERKRITLVTFDTYRIGAVEQLKIYAQLLGLPLEVAFHREDLTRIIEKNLHQDLLLIDTVGRSPRDTKHLEELKDFLTAHPLIENHLLLSATTKEKDLGRVVQQYSFLPIKSYLFTKLDETEEYGPLLNQLLHDRKPLSYLTHGQRVPEDIELATKAKVASLVVNAIPWN